MNQSSTTSGAPQPAPQVPPAQPPTQSGIAATTITPATTTTTIVPSSIVSPAPFHPYCVPIAITSFAKNDKLSADANNWLAWRTRITSILKHKKTYGIVTSTITKPLGPDMDSAVVEWIDLDLAATEQILVGLSNNEVNHVVNCHTAAETWSTLRTIHEPTHIQLGQFSISMLWQKRAAEDTDITNHLNELTHTHNLLASQGKHVSDADFKDVMIETLPRSWNPFVSSLLAQATTKSMTVTQLKSTLSEEHQRLKRQTNQTLPLTLCLRHAPKRESRRAASASAAITSPRIAVGSGKTHQSAISVVKSGMRRRSVGGTPLIKEKGVLIRNEMRRERRTPRRVLAREKGRRMLTLQSRNRVAMGNLKRASPQL